MHKALGIISLVAVFSFLWTSIVHPGLAHANDEMLMAQNTTLDSESVGNVTIEIRPGKNNSMKSFNSVIKDLITMRLMRSGFSNIISRHPKTPPNVSPLPGLSASEADSIPGADITIVFDATFQDRDNKTVCLLAIKAMEAGTGRLLASVTKRSGVRVAKRPGARNASITEAVNSAMPELIKELKESLQSDKSLGNSYKIVFVNTPKDANQKIYDILNEACQMARLRSFDRKQKTITFIARCEKDSIDLANALDNGIEKKLPKNKFEFTAKTRKLIIVEFE